MTAKAELPADATGLSAPRAVEPRSGFSWVDLAVVALVALSVLLVLGIVRGWRSSLQAGSEISLEARHLPLYTFLSLTRGVVAYGVSFLFTMVYGYAMARIAGAERVMLPLLDIFQSIPVLGFMPGFVLGMARLFPQQHLGLEIASILMIFTGQAWNMTFSFYASLKSVPPDLVAVARLARMSWWRRFFRLDLSYAATGLVWNSMMSMAGGWFFLMVSEAFLLGEKDFRLPGLGSYVSLAIERGDGMAQLLGILSLLAMIVAVDQVIWRPLVVWSRKFSAEEDEGAGSSTLWTKLRSRSRIWRAVGLGIALVRKHWPFRGIRSLPSSAEINSKKALFGKLVGGVVVGMLVAGGLAGAVKYGWMLAPLSWGDWGRLLGSTGVTMSRVVVAVAVASLWTIPVGVLIGTHPRWARSLQPVIQIAASFPAPMIFPLVVGVMLARGVGLGVSSGLLLLLGAQWYILFNVIAGASGIPRELREVGLMARFSLLQRWRMLILPSILPSLITGWITAVGGAWNASIVAEYMKYKGRILLTTGLGATISQATEQGDFGVLAAAVGIMAVTVTGLNRVLWRPLGEWARGRCSLET